MRWWIAALILLIPIAPVSGADATCTDATADAAARIEACTHAIEAAPTAQTYVDRANVHESAADWAEAEADLDKALSLDPRHVEALAQRAGVRLAIGGRRKEAVADLDRALSIRPSAGLYAMRAEAWSYTDDRRAVTDYTKALALEPQDIATLHGRAETYMRLNEHALARDDYDRALEVDPKYAYTYIGRGRLFRDQLDLKRAVQDFTTAIELEPNNLEAYRERAAAYAAQSKFEPAIADLSRILAASPKDAGALRARRSAYLETGDSTHAIADAEQVFIVAKYVYTSDYLERGIAYVRRGGAAAFARAERSFEQAAAFQRGDERGVAKVVAQLCAIFCPARRVRSVAALLLAAAPSREKLDGNRAIADADAYMGILALKRGDDVKAGAIFAEALSISSESTVARYGRGVVKHNAGDIEGAKDDFARARVGNNVRLLFAQAGIEPIPAPRAVMVDQLPDAGIERDIAICRRGSAADSAPGAKLDFAAEIDACTRVVRAGLAKEAKAQAYADRARWRVAKGDAVGAVDDFNAALTVNPDHVAALIAIGGHYTQQREFDRALTAFDRAVKADAKSWQAYFGRCEARAARGDLKPALADCDRAVAVAGNYTAVKARRAPVLLRAGENTRALQDYDLILREAARQGLPDDPYARFGRAVALKRLGDTAGAAIDLQKARAQEPDVDRQFAEIGIKP